MELLSHSFGFDQEVLVDEPRVKQHVDIRLFLWVASWCLAILYHGIHRLLQLFGVLIEQNSAPVFNNVVVSSYREFFIT